MLSCLQTAVQYLEDEEQMERLFTAKAAALRAERRHVAAERALLAVRRGDAALDMYKAEGMHSDYLRLARGGPPEQLAAALAWVAGEREAQGSYRCDVCVKLDELVHTSARCGVYRAGERTWGGFQPDDRPRVASR